MPIEIIARRNSLCPDPNWGSHWDYDVATVITSSNILFLWVQLSSPLTLQLEIHYMYMYLRVQLSKKITSSNSFFLFFLVQLSSPLTLQLEIHYMYMYLRVQLSKKITSSNSFSLSSTLLPISITTGNTLSPRSTLEKAQRDLYWKFFHSSSIVYSLPGRSVYM